MGHRGPGPQCMLNKQKLLINSRARKRSPVSRINVFRRRGQSSWKYQDKNRGTALKKRTEGISLHYQAVLEETLQPQAETCTMWAPPASLSRLHSRMGRTEHTHTLCLGFESQGSEKPLVYSRAHSQQSCSTAGRNR